MGAYTGNIFEIILAVSNYHWVIYRSNFFTLFHSRRVPTKIFIVRFLHSRIDNACPYGKTF